MSNYNTSVTYWRVNANNNTIATSPSGTGVGTEPIEAPIAGGLYSSGSGTTTIIGVSPGSNFNVFDVGQYLYYIDNNGDYVLMGLIDTIDSATQLTLTANSTGSPSGNETLVAGYSLITSTEAVFIRFATAANVDPSKRDIPDFSTWRVSAGEGGLNNGVYSLLEQISNVGAPLTIAGTATSIPFTFQTMNVFSPYTSGSNTLFFQTTAAFPQYIWIKATPRPTNNTNSLSSQTMFRWTTEETIPAVAIYAGTPLSTLSSAGYSNLGTSGATGTNTGA